MMTRVPTLLLLSLSFLASLPACLSGAGSPQFNGNIPVPGLTTTPGRDGTPREERSLVGNLESSYVLGTGKGGNGANQAPITLPDGVTVSLGEDGQSSRIIANPAVAGVLRRRFSHLGVSNDLSIVETQVVADPLAGIFSDNPEGLPLRANALVFIKGQRVTLRSGYYQKGIQIEGNSEVQMLPGVYFIQKGGFHVSGTSFVSGEGVLIVNVNADPFIVPTTQPNGQVRPIVHPENSFRCFGNSRIDLSGILEPKYQGAVYYQPKFHHVEFRGKCRATLNGVLYAPTSKLVIGNSASLTLNGYFVALALSLGEQSGLFFSPPPVVDENSLVAPEPDPDF